MVSPRSKALELKNREEIISAFNEFKRMFPNKTKIKLLIDLYNEFAGQKVFEYSDVFSCRDCQNVVKKFWDNIIIEWKKK